MKSLTGKAVHILLGGSEKKSKLSTANNEFDKDALREDYYATATPPMSRAAKRGLMHTQNEYEK
jgi:hypothetical protein